jgi:hypothetical protein
MTPSRDRFAQRFSCAVRLAAAAALGLSIAACSPPSRDLQPGRYRATLGTKGGELPFVLVVARDGKGFGLSLASGNERVALTSVKAEPGKLAADLPDARGRLTATISDDELQGEVALAGAGGRTQSVPFKATRGQAWGFFAEPLTDNADAAGRWAVRFTDVHGVTLRGVADLQQKFERVTGTFRTRDFEHRLAGEVHGDELRLARFDGRSGQLYVAKVNARGELAGDAWALPDSRLRFVAVRNPDAVLDDASAVAAP